MGMNPQIKNHPLYKLLREAKVEEFNKKKATVTADDLVGCDFRSIDLRGLDAKGLNMRDCYFRQADLRGIDFSETNLEGASLHNAFISGCFFPIGLQAFEIDLSLRHGTRMRYRK